MPDELSVLNFADDFAEASDVPEVSRWKLRKSADLEARATMGSAKVPGELFEVRLLWADYPGDPPSLKFVDQNTGRIDVPAAWPVVRGFRPTSLDACVNWCIEGFVPHPEWRNDPRYRWDPRGNVLLKVLRTLQEELDEHCTGRFRP